MGKDKLPAPLKTCDLCRWNRHNFALRGKFQIFFSDIGTSTDTKAESAAKLGHHGQRDATLILVAFRHGLRPVEIADLEWSQVEWGGNPALHVRRAKSGKTAVHPIRGDELRMLRELQRGAGAQLWTNRKTHRRMSRVCCMEPPLANENA